MTFLFIKFLLLKKTHATLKITIPNVMWLCSEIKKKTFLFEIFIQRLKVIIFIKFLINDNILIILSFVFAIKNEFIKCDNNLF